MSAEICKGEIAEEENSVDVDPTGLEYMHEHMDELPYVDAPTCKELAEAGRLIIIGMIRGLASVGIEENFYTKNSGPVKLNKPKKESWKHNKKGGRK